MINRDKTRNKERRALQPPKSKLLIEHKYRKPETDAQMSHCPMTHNY